MERPIITIPRGFLKHLNMSWDIDWRGQSAGEQTGGGTQVVYNAFPRWIGSPEIALYREEIREWRAIRAQARGRTGIYVVEMCDPVGFAQANPYPDGIPFSNGQPFSTGYGWQYEPMFYGVGFNKIGAETIRVNVAGMGIAPVAGQIMSHDDWPFVVTTVAEVSTGIYDLGIEMPLRAPIRSGDPILLKPRGRFEVLEDTTGNPAYGASRYSQVQLEFREVLTR